MKRILRSLPLLLIGYCLALSAAFGQGRNQPKVVATIADLVATDPRNFADSFTGTNLDFLAIVTTTGDNSPGAGTRTWRWNRTSTATTNAILDPAGPGPFAWPYGASAGRWQRVPDASLLTDRDFGGIYLTNGGTGWYVTPRGITPSMLPAAPSPSILGRNSGAGSGDLGFLGFSSEFLVTNDVVSIDPVIMDSINTGWGSVDSMADMVTAIASPNHPAVFHVKSYWRNNQDIGGGIWFHQITDYPTNRAVPVSAKGGRMWPRFDRGFIDTTRFGAQSMALTAVTDPAVQDALAMQQDRTIAGTLWSPEGYYRLINTIRRKQVGTGTGYLVNNAGGYPIGATNIVLDTGTGTILERDTVYFGSVEMGFDYRVVSWNPTNNTLRIAFPGLLETLADNQAMQIRPRPRLTMLGMNHGIVQTTGLRSHGATTYVMESDNIPIIEIGGYHNRIEMMSLQYDNFQQADYTNAVCILNPGTEDLYQNVINGVSMMRGAYGIKVEATPSGPNRTAPNNWLYNILVETATASDVWWAKSGTQNVGFGWYLQNLANQSNGLPSFSQTFTNLTKSGSTITLHFPTLPGQIQEGMYIDVTGITNFNGQFCVKSISGNQVIYDVVGSAVTNSVTQTTGTGACVIKSQMTGPLFYNIAGFAIVGLDAEATIAPEDPNVPAVIWNQGGHLAINGFHGEYIFCRKNNQSLIKSSGGLVTIDGGDWLNMGRNNTNVVYVFETDTLDGTANTQKGNIDVRSMAFRDFSINAGGSGAWLVGTNKNSCSPVTLGNYMPMTSLRANTTNRLSAGTAETWVRAALTIP
jgi:hypothetical protein